MSILREHAPKEPHEDFDSAAISQVIWALSDASGAMARNFAKLEPTPPIGWLRHLKKAGLLGGLLSHPPTPNAISLGLIDWLVKHLDAPALREWIIEEGACLHPWLAYSIRQQLPNAALPDGLMRLWRFLSSPDAPLRPTGRPLQKKACPDHADLLEVRACLAPRIRITRPWPGPTFDESRVDSFACADLEPAGGASAWICANSISDLDGERVALLLEELTGNLALGLRHLEFLGQVTRDQDGTWIMRPSIGDSRDNTPGYKWSIYVQLLRDTWTATATSNPLRARAEVVRWMWLPYPIFRRFVLWSATAHAHASPSLAEIVNYVVEQPASLLWGPDTRNELLQFLQHAVSRLSPESLRKLEAALLSGPPRTKAGDVKGTESEELDEKFLWHCLAVLSLHGGKLSSAVSNRLTQIRTRWNLPENPTTAGSLPVGPIWDQIDARANGGRDFLAKTEDEVVSALSGEVSPEALASWGRMLREQPDRSILVLETLSTMEPQPSAVWKKALGAGLEGGPRRHLLHLVGQVVARLGEAFKSENIKALTSLVRSEAESPGEEAAEDVWRLWDEIEPSALDALDGNAVSRRNRPSRRSSPRLET